MSESSYVFDHSIPTQRMSKLQLLVIFFDIIYMIYNAHDNEFFYPILLLSVFQPTLHLHPISSLKFWSLSNKIIWLWIS